MNETYSAVSASAGRRLAAAPAAPGHQGTSITVDSVEKVFWTWKQSRFRSTVTGGFTALAPVSFQVQPGEFVSIVGPSGCGKSTLLSIIAGLAKPSGGRVLIGDAVVTGPGRRSSGMVFQQISLLPWLTAEQNVAFALDKRTSGARTRQEISERARHALAMVGLHSFESYYPRQLSGGMQQRVAIARALVIEPEVLIMDEPFGALDAQTRMTLQDELTRLQSQWRGSIVFVTHDIDEAVYLSDRVLVMGARPGRIVSTVDVDLPRPRDSVSTRSDPEFSKLVAGIWSTLRPLAMTAYDGD